MTLDITHFLCLDDNFGVLARDQATGHIAVIDAPEFDAVDQAVMQAGGKLDSLLITHHHQDHVQGIVPLKEKYGCKVYGPAASFDRIKGLDVGLAEGDKVSLGSSEAVVIETPGHTLDHIIYYAADAKVAFVADTMFAMGCGRVFEGTMEQMWQSLVRIAELPEDTRLYFGHEYTLGNAGFAEKYFPDDEAISARVADVRSLREQGGYTVPTTVAKERATNPFLKALDPATARMLGMEGASSADVFAKLRALKDKG